MKENCLKEKGHKKESRTEHMGEIALIGNPNVGKSVIFGLLTGKYAAVSNYPGTTVEITQGNISLDSKRLLVIDTPGVNTLTPMSEDERVTRDILLASTPSVVLQVGDAKNLKRTLLITLQLAEMGLPMILDLNMVDEAMDRGISIDKEKLRTLLGIDVVETIAPQRKGLGDLREALSSAFEGYARSAIVKLEYPPAIEEYIRKISALLPAAGISKRSIAVMVLSDDESLRPWLHANISDDVLSKIEGLRDECKLGVRGSPGYLINVARIKAAEEITKRVLKKRGGAKKGLSDFLGRMSMHPVYGIPVLLIVLFGFYEFVGVFGAGTLVDFMEDAIFAKYINPAATKAVKVLAPVEILQELLIGEYGLITVAMTYAIAIILPITAAFFIAFAILEDSGYLPRLAIMSNRAFNIIGLNGKAVLPMVLGLGCGTMAVMTSRILETKRDRILTTFLIALAIPCSAQLGVILGMLGSLSWKATIIWSMS
ncbi:MAG: ferrous iron transport protein B, partial [Nitrospirae bacterium]|nr:ferrous iron transport protein B [Nitrospirota bacterium]